MASECVFCAIVSGELPARVVSEDDDTVAFMDINPWRPGHALVVPRRHARDLLEIEDEELGRVFLAGRRLAARMRERLGCERVHMWNSCGAAAGQVVGHFHLHVIPGDADDPELPPRAGARAADTAEIERSARALRAGA